MVNTSGFEDEWFKRSDVQEVLHFVSRNEEDGLTPRELKELRKKGSENSNQLILRMLSDIEVLEKEEDRYIPNYEAFADLVEERWVEFLSDTQRRFVVEFSRLYVKERKHSTVRHMIAGAMVQGVLKERDEMDEELVDLADNLDVEDEGYRGPSSFVREAAGNL